jgi:DNA-nicking Smr family endonuclease
MSDKVTERDLLQAIRNELALPLQKGEFTTAMWRDILGMGQGQAESELKRLLRQGVIEKVPAKRIGPHGKTCCAYRRRKQ